MGTILLGGARLAAADGETSPMFGVAVVGGDEAQSPQQDAPLAGLALDIAWWHGRVGIAGEGSARWDVEHESARALVAGASLRVLLLDRLTPSPIEPSDVETALELQAIVERTWWNVPSQVDPTSFGVGLALRLRGSDELGESNVLAESRFFVRVLASRWAQSDVIARSTTPAAVPARALTVLLGIGASFGAGRPDYARRFRLHPFDPALLDVTR